MTLIEIKEAVLTGKYVKWKFDNYDVIYDPALDDFLICCVNNKDCIGLEWEDGETLNGNEEDFYIKEK